MDSADDPRRGPAFVLLVILPVLPGLHPRMASPSQGPSVRRLLEPPGLMAMNYGVRTPIAVVASHVIFGAILGAGYVVSP